MAESTLESLTEGVVDLTEEAPIRVLHVDDEPGFLKVAKRCLEIEGAFQVETALSVEEAMKKLEKETFDAIVSDYVMPGKNGLEFLKELRLKGNSIPFIIFTGKGREEVAIKALNYGADQYLNKAGNPETVYGELAYGIRQAVKNKRIIAGYKRVEEAQRESEWKFRAITQFAGDAIIMFTIKADNEAYISYWNPTAERMFGYTKEEVINKKLKEFLFDKELKPLKLEKLLRPSRRLTSFRETGKGAKRPIELRAVRKDGTEIPIELSLSVLQMTGEHYVIICVVRDITERKKTEEARSRRHFQTLFNLMPDPVVIVDEQGKILEVSDSLVKIGGFKREELVGKNFLKIKGLTAKSKAVLMKNLMKRMTGAEIAPYEIEMLTKDGKKIFAEVNAAKIGYMGKTADMVIFRDLTERKKAEEELKRAKRHIQEMFRETEEKYRKLFEEALDAIVVADAETGIMIDCNRAASELVGREKSELVGKHQRILHPSHEIEGGFSGTFKQHLKGKEGQVLETQVITKKGEIKDVAIKANVFELGDKKLIQGTFRDITERKEAEEALAQERDLLYTLMDNIPDTIYFKDVNSRFTRTNKAHAKVLGLKDPKEVVGKTDFDFFSGEHAQAAYMDEQKIVKTGKPLINKEEKPERVNGQFRWVSTTKVPIKDKEGRVTGIVGISRNITERKKAEEKLNETLKKLKLLNEKLRVVGKLARHDVRNKLSTVTGNVFLAKRRLTSDREVLEYLKDVESACQQVEEIFDFARTYEMLGVEKLVYMDVEKSLEEAVSLFSDLHGVKVVNDCRGLTVLADSLLRQLFYNLMDNSLKHGEKVSRIRVHYEETGKDQLKLVYEDDGVGIPKAEKEKIFEEGYGKGTGYGLYLIKRICEVYGWTIRETGKQGKGARFTVTIPKMDESGKEKYRFTSPAVTKAKVKNTRGLSRLTVPRARH